MIEAHFETIRNQISLNLKFLNKYKHYVNKPNITLYVISN